MFTSYPSQVDAYGFELRARRARTETLNAAVSVLGHTAAAGLRQLGDRVRELEPLSFRRWRDRVATINELSRLDDRLLKDIGVHRDGIESVAEALVESRYGHGSDIEVPYDLSAVRASANDNEGRWRRVAAR